MTLRRHIIGLGVFAVAAVHLHVGRGRRPRRGAALAFALRIHDAEIMLGVLIQVFRRDAVAAGLRLARQRDIALEHLIGVAADFNVRAVAVESLLAMRRARPVVVGAGCLRRRHRSPPPPPPLRPRDRLFCPGLMIPVL